jgi:hypothetical protein
VFALFVSALIVALPASATSIILNGSFEDVQIANNYYQCVGTCTGSFIEPSTYLPHWTVGLTSVDIVSSPLDTGGHGAQWWSESGNQGIDMAGTPGPGSLSQIVTTGAGTKYSLSFWVSSNGGAKPDALVVDWNGSALTALPLSTPAQGTGWVQYTFVVTGTGGSDTLAFVDLIGGNAGPLLDNVSLDVATPEPGTMVLFGAAAAVLALVRRRRKTA